MAVIQAFQLATPPNEPQSQSALITQENIGKVPSTGTLTGVINTNTGVLPSDPGYGHAY
jgi:hypothetical protein